MYVENIFNVVLVETLLQTIKASFFIISGNHTACLEFILFKFTLLKFGDVIGFTVTAQKKSSVGFGGIAEAPD